MYFGKYKNIESYEENIDQCLALVFDGNIEEAFELLENNKLTLELLKKRHSKVNRNNYNFDESYINSKSNEKLSYIIKFYTLFETRYHNLHSVTAIPYLVRLLSERNFEGYEQLVEWAIETAHSENEYIPFGEFKYRSCKSLSEYKRLSGNY